MNPLQQDFDRLRCAGTPWCLILTPDYRECNFNHKNALGSPPVDMVECCP
jgi:hypothetical protein